VCGSESSGSRGTPTLTHTPTFLWMECVNDLLGRLRAEARQRSNLLDRCILDPLQASESVEQLTPAPLTDTRDSQQLGGDGARRSTGPLERDGEPVCLVARLLEHAKRRR